MKAETIHHVAAPSNLKLMLLRAENITLDFYRFLYDAVGRNFNWYDRRYFTDAELTAAIHAEGVEVWVLYVGGQPAGYFELVPREDNVMELEYFGMIPDFSGTRPRQMAARRSHPRRLGQRAQQTYRGNQQPGRPKGASPLPENGLHPLRPGATGVDREGLGRGSTQK